MGKKKEKGNWLLFLKYLSKNCTLIKGGWLCDESIDSIANTLFQIEKEREEIFERGINAKNYVKERLTWSMVAQQWIVNVSETLNVRG